MPQHFFEKTPVQVAAVCAVGLVVAAAVWRAPENRAVETPVPSSAVAPTSTPAQASDPSPPAPVQQPPAPASVPIAAAPAPDVAQELRSLRAELLAAHEQIARMQQGTSDPPGASTAADAADTDVEDEEPVPPGPVLPKPNTLGLTRTTTAAADGDGMVATMDFVPAGDAPLAPIVVVARLPRESKARILDFKVAGDVAFPDLSVQVSPDGMFAILQGTPGTVEPLSIVLSVSAPTQASIRGSSGIPPIELDLRPEDPDTPAPAGDPDDPSAE